MALDLPSWLDAEFIQRILRLTQLDITINVVDILSKAATNKSDNYLSDMVRVVVNFTHKEDENEVEGKKSLIFKFAPLTDGLKKQIIKESPMFDTEIAMMSHVLKKMNDMLESQLVAYPLYIKLEEPLCLIMEDLAPQGFRMADRLVGFDLAHSILVIQGLAKFHATSVALCEKYPRYKSIFTKGVFYEGQPEKVGQFWVLRAIQLASEIEQWPELGKSYADKLRNWAPKLHEKAIDVMRCKEDEFNVINHGDCWVNNMLFRYNENSKPIEQIFVDFQLSVYSSPAIDLHYFLCTSVSEEVALNNIADLYNEYLRTLTVTMQKLNCKTLPPTMQELKKILKERAMYMLIISIGVLPIIFVDKSEAKDINEMATEANEGGFPPHPGLKSQRYRRIISRKMPEFVEMGLLDV